MAGDDDALVAAHSVDLPLHRMNVGDRRIVEIFAPDERGEVGEEALAERDIARRRARFDERGALPVLADRLVVGVGAQGGQGDWRRGRIGPQAKVDPEHVAVARSLLQQARERLGHAHEQLRRLRSFRNRGRRGVVEHDKIDVARIIELARAVLAERQHDHAGARLRIGRLRVERQSVRKRVLAQKEGERGADGGVGEAGQRLGRRDEVPYAADIGKRDQKRRFTLGPAQRAHQLRFVVVAPRGERPNQRVERFARRTPEQPDEPGRVLPDQRPKVGRMVGEAEKAIAGPAALELGREVRRGLDQRSEAAPGFRRRGEPRRVDEAFSERCGHSRPGRRAPAVGAAHPRQAA